MVKDGQVEQLGGGSIIPGDAGKTLEYEEKKCTCTAFKLQEKGHECLLRNGEIILNAGRWKNKNAAVPAAPQFAYSEGVPAVEASRVVDDIARFFSTKRNSGIRR